jgi:hypothetical protein
MGIGRPAGNISRSRPMNKYRNKPIYVDGTWFQSMKEGKRYQELCLLERAGEIKKLRRQVVFPFDVNGIKICSYRADFVYIQKSKDGWDSIVEDTKGRKIQPYPIKKKLMKAIYGVDILET